MISAVGGNIIGVINLALPPCNSPLQEPGGGLQRLGVRFLLSIVSNQSPAPKQTKHTVLSVDSCYLPDLPEGCRAQATLGLAGPG
ncbi:hypothetical protein CGRA01v4_10485 [Colletotrichum graminicola]|nr:hypothetical protein CGRA01v4_10485 [Colletotrichum graminicola]